MERHRRQPANVQHLLLERSLHPVRHRLICRVHRLSRRLWRKIKATDRPEERSSTSPTTLSSVEVVEGNVLPPESAVTDPKSSQDEAYLKHFLVTRLLLVAKFKGLAAGNKGGSKHTHSRVVCHNGLRCGAHACYVGAQHLQQSRLRQWMEQPETVE
ncbi:hypothetical protein EGR_10183 [Echinococcus granulosus]|uniref:Uncharacterized protein n=1 Tax=Echinococcus granulosus TaxID=6210 RepID=W6U1N6_ECHGR|nr:hypothetical protein EGR_10183 [Echinococcus granulosus]EUB54948.1 hypothetical protein EGR_10183 [Echinococcus granulosus]